MNSIAIGWECNSAQNSGDTMAIPVNTEINLVGLQIDCSMMFIGGTVGWAEALFCGYILSPASWANWAGTGSNPQQYINVPSDPTFGAAGIAGTAHGGGGGTGSLFNIILKAAAPSATGRGLYIPLTGITVPASYGIFLHMDQMGNLPCDLEMQGTLFFNHP